MEAPERWSATPDPRQITNETRNGLTSRVKILNLPSSLPLGIEDSFCQRMLEPRGLKPLFESPSPFP